MTPNPPAPLPIAEPGAPQTFAGAVMAPNPPAPRSYKDEQRANRLLSVSVVTINHVAECGRGVQFPSGAAYGLTPDGKSLRRLNKPPRGGKKARRARRAELKALEARSIEEIQDQMADLGVGGEA